MSPNGRKAGHIYTLMVPPTLDKPRIYLDGELEAEESRLPSTECPEDLNQGNGSSLLYIFSLNGSYTYYVICLTNPLQKSPLSTYPPRTYPTRTNLPDDNP